MKLSNLTEFFEFWFFNLKWVGGGYARAPCAAPYLNYKSASHYIKAKIHGLIFGGSRSLTIT